MISKYIKYNDISSKDLGLRLIDDIEFTSPNQDVEFVEISGVDGAKIKDNKRLSLVDRSFPFVLYSDGNRDINYHINKLNTWLLSTNGAWKDFELSWDSSYLYKAIFYESFSLSGTLKQKKKCILNFKIHPVKYLKVGQEKINVSQGQVLNNPENRVSKPLIKLIGTGDVDLSINTKIFRLKKVQGHIVLDCESQSAYYGDNEPQYNKVFSYPFPKLESGNNTIRWNNSSFRVEIIPRWEAIV